MPSSPEINIVPSHKIDFAKWDNCIRNSSNALIYAYSFYLNKMADNWSGIVVNDYDCVMPVPWRKKLGIKYCYDVPFIQQLGWFAQKEIKDISILKNILFRFCRYGDYAFNYQNIIFPQNNIQCNNFTLDLSKSYSNIALNYKHDFISNLKKAQKENFIYTDENIETAIDAYKNLYSERMPHVNKKDYDNFYQICIFLSEKKMAFAKKISANKNETLAIALFLKDENRLYNIMNSTTAAGRKTEANHFLFDSVFREFAESRLVLDFEGSDIAGVKSFYEKCGTVNQPYFKIHFNHLPFPLNLLKR